MATPTTGSHRTVLIIDDQPFFINMQQTMLKQQGYQVLSSTSGPEGLKLAKKHKPDLILLDIEMPVMDGFAVCQQLRQDEELRQIPVIILTGTQDPKLNEKAFKAGADVTVLKSISGERLINMIRIALEKGKSPAAP